MRPRLFIQLPPAAGDDPPGLNYREDFRSWVKDHGDPRSDHVVLYSLDPKELQSLRALWSAWPLVEVKFASACWDPGCSGSTVVYRTSQGSSIVQGTDESLIRRLNPAAEPSTYLVSCDRFGVGIGSPDSPQMEQHLCLDLRGFHQPLMTEIPETIHVIHAVTADVPHEWLRSWVDELRGIGMRPAGRPFGEAGTSMTLVKSSSIGDLTKAIVREVWIRAGALVARITRQLTSTRTDIVRSQRFGTHSLEAPKSPPSTSMSRAEVAYVVERIESRPNGAWSIPIDEPDPDDISLVCHERYGVFPISFSYPFTLPLQEPSEQLSVITPGFPYSFTDNATYLATYAKSALGLTFRKAGWDCFRHVEILAAGAIPLMPDAAQIPPFAMVHYPRRAMVDVAAHAMSLGGQPDHGTRLRFRHFFERHLTSAAMARYILRMSGHESARRVLFVDAQTPTNPEYQSTLTLIGLKELLGTSCEVAFPASFLYRDSKVSSSSFYGRGFGYTHVIDPLNRTESEERDARGHGLDRLDDYDAVVLGSVSRNVDISRQVLRSCDPRRVIVIHGEDGPPTPTDVRELRGSGASVFVRAIHAGPAA